MDKKEELKKLLAENDYKVLVVNTYTGRNWDNAASKVFALIVGGQPLNPYALREMGFNNHFKEEVAQNQLFYDGVIGMSRPFNIVYHLSDFLFEDGYKLKYY